MGLNIDQQIRDIKNKICRIERGGVAGNYPYLLDCPTGDESILMTFVNSYVTTANPNGHVYISFANLFACIAAGLNRKEYRLQFIIGDGSSVIFNGDSDILQLPVDGGSQMIISVPNILNDSVELTWDGLEMPRELTDRESYGVVYSDISITINRLPTFKNGQLYILKFSASSATSYGSSTFKLDHHVFTATATNTIATGPIPVLVGATIKWIQKEISPLKNAQYFFDVLTGEITLLGGLSLDVTGGIAESLYILYTIPIA